MGSENSSLDDLCVCDHPRRRHYEAPQGECVACAGDQGRPWRHEFEPKDTPRKEGAGGSEGGHAHEWGEWEPFARGRVRIARRTCPCGATDSRPGRFCGHCEGPHATEDCKGVEEPEEAAERPSRPAPRPPYAVAYSVGGQLYETYLPGDATATAVDGMLQITHDGPVLAIVSVKPIKEASADAA